MFKKKKIIARVLLTFMFMAFLLGPINSIGKSLTSNDLVEVEKEIDKIKNKDLRVKLDEDDITLVKDKDLEDKDLEDKDLEDKDLEDKEEENKSEDNLKNEEDEDKNDNEPIEKVQESDEKENLDTIYVDINAGESGDGSKEKPFISVNKAIEYSNREKNKLTTIKISKGKYNLKTTRTNYGNIIQIKEDTSIIGEDGVEIKINGELSLGKVPRDNVRPEIVSNKTNINIKNLKINVDREADYYWLSISPINARLSMENIELGYICLEQNDRKQKYSSLGIDGFGSEIELKNIKNLGNVNLNESKINMEDIKMGYSEYYNGGDSLDYFCSTIGLDNSYINIKRIKNLGEIYLYSSKLEAEDIDMKYNNYSKYDVNEEYASGSLYYENKSDATIKGIRGLGEIYLNKSSLDIETLDMTNSYYSDYEGEVMEELSIVDSQDSTLTIKNAQNLDLLYSKDSNIELDKVEIGNIDANAYNDDISKEYIFSIKNSKTKDLLEKEEIKDKDYLFQGMLLDGYDQINIKNFKYRNNLNGIEINSNSDNPDSIISINNLTIENVIDGPGAITIEDAGKLYMKDINLKNNINSIVHLDNTDYYIENLNISTDEELDKLIEICEEEIYYLGQDWGIDELLFRYGLISNCVYNENMDHREKNKGEINGLQVDLNNKTIERNWLNLEFNNMDEKINKLNIKSNGMNNLQTCFHAIDSGIVLTNSSLGDLEASTGLALEILDSNLELVNNTIVNHELGSENIEGTCFDVDYSTIDLDKLDNKFNNNILDIKESSILEESDCQCYKNIIEDSSFNNNILLNLEEENLSSEDKENIFLDKYEEIKFKDKFNLELDKTSPAVDKGNNDYLAKEYDSDLANKPRISNKIVDIGAYEYQKIRDVEYIVRYVDENGQNLLNEIEKIGKENEKVVEKAKNINGYKLLGDKEKDLVLKYGEKNELVFKYKKIEKPEEPEFPEVPEEPEKPELNKKEHFAYILGYKDGSVGPENEMVREEVAAVFFRLLDPEYRESIRKDSHNFPDFPKNKWSAKHIGTLAKGEILEGNEDGDFLPDRPISRAEIAAIASRFDDGKGPRVFKSKFKDIEGHWAEEEIKKAEKLGWVIGDENGNFNPDEKVSRGEFVTMVNRVLNRKVRKENILEGVRVFTDLEEGKWYYEDMVEATNGHVYNEDRFEDGSEEWLELEDFNIEM